MNKVRIQENSLFDYELIDDKTEETLDRSTFRLELLDTAKRLGVEVVDTFGEDDSIRTKI